MLSASMGQNAFQAAFNLAAANTASTYYAGTAKKLTRTDDERDLNRQTSVREAVDKLCKAVEAMDPQNGRRTFMA
jgi:hypothetical protein